MLIKAITWPPRAASLAHFLDNFQHNRDHCRGRLDDCSWKGKLMFTLRGCSRSGKHSHMASSPILDRVDSLIDDLLNDGNLSSSSLASMFMAARESVRDGYHIALARRMWDASNDLKLRECQGSADLIGGRLSD
jgi:hypothetical protein